MENKSKTYSYICVKFSSLWIKLCECLTSVLVHAPHIKLAQFNLIYESTIVSSHTCACSQTFYCSFTQTSATSKLLAVQFLKESCGSSLRSVTSPRHRLISGSDKSLLLDSLSLVMLASRAMAMKRDQLGQSLHKYCLVEVLRSDRTA